MILQNDSQDPMTPILIPAVFLQGTDGLNIARAIEELAVDRRFAVLSAPINSSGIMSHDMSPWSLWL